ncbi:hypothetical protein CI109_104167 [Kwoniella shandongensis]|uniref:Uncharacterized protein n=1 Tax=Kwoniella shandongensis TaxID=1734106 RepID=A0A5M6C187_9TREE|nr:uncharacterized protein CI109_002921 [Kwoniella shandongensis]KAA5528763.1 hypothetical protein CI109_002921 [Kwoniella shandongensis]
MVLPSVISEPSPIDPLVLLPLPNTLPSSPISDLDPLLSALEAHLSPSSTNDPNVTKLPIPVLTALMRQITRRSQVLLNAARVGAAEAREELDGVDGDLRGVEYERERVKEEIDRCMEYAPAYEELDLPDIESFLASADESVLSSLPPKDDEGYEHAVTIARLENELNEITKREAHLAQLTKDRDALIRAKKEIKIKFDAVDVHLTGFGRSANAVAAKLKDVAEIAGSTAVASSTPAPSPAPAMAPSLSS